MKTFLKVLLVVLLALVLLKLLPVVFFPFGAALGVLLGLGAIALLIVAGVVAGVAGIAFGLILLALGLLVVLSPILLPILAVVGLVSLCRRRPAAVRA